MRKCWEMGKREEKTNSVCNKMIMFFEQCVLRLTIHLTNFIAVISITVLPWIVFELGPCERQS